MEELIVDYKFNGVVLQVSNMGRVYKDGTVLNPRTDKDGYLRYSILNSATKQTKSIGEHKIVALCFVDGYFDKAEANHKDFNRKNNKADNLEWLSHAENNRYSRKYNPNAFRSIVGENNIKCRLTESDVLEIRKMIEDGWRTFEIAKKYSIGWSTVYNIKIRNTWKHI